jgi:hypothetical protein
MYFWSVKLFSPNEQLLTFRHMQLLTFRHMGASTVCVVSVFCNLDLFMWSILSQRKLGRLLTLKNGTPYAQFFNSLTSNPLFNWVPIRTLA